MFASGHALNFNTSKTDRDFDRMDYYCQRIQGVKSRIRLRQFIKHIPYDTLRNLILPSETECYRFIALIYLIMKSDSDHIPIVYILQQVIEQFITLATKWVIGSVELGGMLRRTFHCVPRVLERLYSLVFFHYFKYLLRHISTLLLNFKFFLRHAYTPLLVTSTVAY